MVRKDRTVRISSKSLELLNGFDSDIDIAIEKLVNKSNSSIINTVNECNNDVNICNNKDYWMKIHNIMSGVSTEIMDKIDNVNKVV